jgi:hypothetical protein
LVPFEIANGRFLVGTHERTVARDIGRENSGQSTFKSFGHARIPRTDACSLGQKLTRRSDLQEAKREYGAWIQQTATTDRGLISAQAGSPLARLKRSKRVIFIV